MADDGDKTEQPTGKRLAEARERGNVPRTGEASTAMTVLAAAAFLSWSGPGWVAELSSLLPSTLGDLPATPWTPVEAHDYMLRMLGRFVALAAPPIVVIGVCVVAVNLAQVGFIFSTHSLTPNFAKLNPLKGFGVIFGRGALVELAKAPLKLLLLGAIAYATVSPRVPVLLGSAGRDASAVVASVADLAVALLWRLGAAHAVLAAGDYAYQRWSHRRQLRMSREEVKEETRQAEGDPAIRARFRSLHRQYAMRRMLLDVPTADVVVTNPTHLAVALKYDATSMRAPRVIAKGARLIAQRIRERAEAAGVPIVEHRPLAQALYKAVPLGGEIPAALYRAVAEILAYVWALGRSRARA